MVKGICSGKDFVDQPPRVIHYWLDFIEGREFVTKWVPEWGFTLEKEGGIEIRMQMCNLKQLCKVELYNEGV